VKIKGALPEICSPADRHTGDGLANFTDFPLQAARGVDELFITASASNMVKKSKGKVFPYSLPSVGPGADPGVQAVSPQVT